MFYITELDFYMHPFVAFLNEQKDVQPFLDCLWSFCRNPPHPL